MSGETPPDRTDRVFANVVRYIGLALAVWLILTDRVEPTVGLGFTGGMIAGTIGLESYLRSRK